MKNDKHDMTLTFYRQGRSILLTGDSTAMLGEGTLNFYTLSKARFSSLLASGSTHELTEHCAAELYTHSVAKGGSLSLRNSLGKQVILVQSAKNNAGLVLVNDFDGKTKEGLSGDRP